MADQAVGGTVVIANRLAPREFRKNPRGKLLAELDSPLVEAVQVPDDALNENLVFVEGDQGAEPERGQPAVEDRGGRPVSLEDLVGEERLQALAREALRLELGPGLGFGLAEGEGFGL